jgi:hypothetical protein
MSDIDTKRCDAPQCGAIREQANRWWVVMVSPKAVVIVSNDDFYADPRTQRWLPAESEMEGPWDRLDACGEQCAQALAATFLKSRAHLHEERDK